MPTQPSDFDPMIFFCSRVAFTSNTATFPLQDSVSGDGGLQPDDVSPIKHEPPKALQHVNVDHNELLDFGIAIGYLQLLDCSMRQCQVSITAQLYGRFSLCGNAFQTPQLKHGVPKQGVELICYRRNLFQITGSVALPPGLRYVMSLEGNRIPILAQELAVSAIETVEDKSIELVLVPHEKKHSEESIVGQASNPRKSSPPISLDITKVQSTSNGLSNFPFTWGRLQFNTATKNNGKSQNLQQKFVIRIQLMATLSTGVNVPLRRYNPARLWFGAVARGNSDLKGMFL